MKTYKQYTLFSWFVIFFAAMGGVLYGYDLGVISGALLFINHDIPMTLAQSSFLVGAVLGGGAIATLVSGALADLFGRKSMIIISAILFIIGVLAVVYAHSYFLLMLGRIIQGVGVGIITIVIPLYLAETLPSTIRGRGISTFQLMLTLGIVLANMVSIYFVPTQNWRGMFMSATIPGILLLLGGLFLPYSPRWLFNKGYEKKALFSFSKTHHESWIAGEWKNFIASVSKEDQTITSYFKALRQPKFLRPMLIVLSVACLQQLMGVNSILQFSAYLLKDNGLSSKLSAVLGSNVVAMANFGITLVAMFFIDKIGRRQLLCFGTGSAALSLLYLGAIYWLLPFGQIKALAMLVGFVWFILSYAVGPGLCIWIVLAELLPSKIRSTGMSVALCANSLISTAFASAFLPLAQQISYGGIFFICAIASTAYCLVCYNCIPEAKNKSLEDIEKMMNKSSVIPSGL
jgi:SP family galactose:H+ symporter-like MFS transporter